MSGFNITDEDENSLSIHYRPLSKKLSLSMGLTDGFGERTNVFQFINAGQLASLIQYLQDVQRNIK